MRDPEPTMLPVYRFKFVTSNTLLTHTLETSIKTHFRAYQAKNLLTAITELAANLLSDFKYAKAHTIHRLGYGAWQIDLGNIVSLKFHITYDGYTMTEKTLERLRNNHGIPNPNNS